jgi:hypothetical protein
MRGRLDQVVERSTGGQQGDEGDSSAHERQSATDERFAICHPMVIIFVFLLGIGNFALHQAVLKSRHPILTQMAWLVDGLGGRASLVLEFVLLVVALLLAAAGHPGWTLVYVGYSVLNALSAWLILSNRI